VITIVQCFNDAALVSGKVSSNTAACSSLNIFHGDLWARVSTCISGDGDCLS